MFSSLRIFAAQLAVLASFLVVPSSSAVGPRVPVLPSKPANATKCAVAHAVADTPSSTLVLDGTFSCDTPSVFLGQADGSFVELFVTSSSPTYVDVELPLGLTAGNYLVNVQCAVSCFMDITVGAVGPQGSQGKIGPQGVQGDAGATGPQGIQGEAGAVGPQGIQGEAGSQGVQGDTGAEGPQGVQGAAGAEGPQGIQGEAGAVGPQGIQGEAGPAGPTGAVGPMGPSGSQADGPCVNNRTDRFQDCGNGTVTDTVSGLIWAKEWACVRSATWKGASNWVEGLADGECGLTDGSSAGDWRLPTIEEWRMKSPGNTYQELSMVNLGCAYPAIPDTQGTGCWSAGDPFDNVRLSFYWSATSFSVNPLRAWGANLATGAVTNGDKNANWGVAPVRGAP